MNSLIRAIGRNTEDRKRKKKQVDAVYKLSSKNEAFMSASIKNVGENRLLDEGAIIEGDGSVWAYIKKGTLRKFLEGRNERLPNLPDDFVGSVNIGHNSFIDWPFPVGQWTKEDLSLVDIGDEREGLNVDVKIDEDSIFIQELRRLAYELSLSVEMYYELDYEASDTMEIPVIDEIFIYEYAIVGDGKNVNSNGLMLKGEDMKLEDNLSVEEELEITEPAEEPAEEPVEEPAEEPAEEPTEEQEEEANEEPDGEEDEEAEVEEGEEADEDEGDEVIAELNATIEALRNTVAELTAQNSALKKSNRKLNSKLKDEKDKRDAFAAKVKNISVKLGVNEQADEKPRRSTADYINGDGIKE